MHPETKECPKCKTVKPFQEFGLRPPRNGKSLVQAWCKECRQAATDPSQSRQYVKR